ncbi:GNAT family N-acetyltransferase [Lysinimonas soli]|uniref:GNAT family N-acetyltransferase n=1 Tax=Lysinimonas soli TaxID=1074233 RepID=A0ABW0NMA0_9MICO
MTTEFAHEPDAHRYTMRVGGDVVSILEYQDHGVGTVMHHTVTLPRFRGKGYAAELVGFAVDDVETRGRGPIIPSCWYVAEWFERHPERSALLAAR